MKGIILAGGLGSRLYPMTLTTSKQLLPVYDKPMIYYPISVLMLAGIKEILIISTPTDLPNFKKLLKDGSQFGIKFEYLEQPKPEGIAQAFILAEDFIQDDNATLILGDNLFYGKGFSELLKKCQEKITSTGGGIIFGYQVKNSKRYGVIELNNKNEILSIEEKPKNPKSDYAVTGLYMYDNNVIKYSKQLTKSKRGELEITDLNNIYLKNKQLQLELLGRGFTWLDMGTPQSLLKASQYIQTIEENQGIKIACLEEISYKMNYITKQQILKNIKTKQKNEYNSYILKIFQNNFSKYIK